jgi:hypothetical protein
MLVHTLENLMGNERDSPVQGDGDIYAMLQAWTHLLYGEQYVYDLLADT